MVVLRTPKRMQSVDSVGDAGDSRPPGVCVCWQWHRRQCCVQRRPETAGGHPVTAGRGQEFDGVSVPALQSLSTSRPVALTRSPPWDVVVAVAVLGTPAVLEKQVVVAATLQQATLHPTLHPAEKKKMAQLPTDRTRRTDDAPGDACGGCDPTKHASHKRTRARASRVALQPTRSLVNSQERPASDDGGPAGCASIELSAAAYAK